MSIGDLLFWFIPVLLNLLILLWIRCGCEVDTRELYKFPSRGHIILLTLISFVPVVGALEFIVWLGVYISFRIEGNLTLKANKFNKYWFEIDEN